MSLPILRPTEPGHPAGADAVIALGVVVSIVWLGVSGVDAHLPYIVPAALYVGAGTPAATLGAHPTSGILAVGQDVGALAWSAAIANVIRTPEAFVIVTRAWVYGATAWAVALVLAMLARRGGLGGPDPLPGFSSLGDPSVIGNVLALSFFVSLVGPSPRSSLARLAVGATLLIGVAVSGSHAAIWAVVVGGVATGFVSIWRRHDLMAAIGSLGIGLVLLACALVAVGIAHRLESGVAVPSIDRPATIAVTQRPLFFRAFGPYLDGTPVGIGPGGIRADGSAPQGGDPGGTYLVTLVERGPVGVIGLIVLVFGLLIRAHMLALRGLSSAFQHLVREPSALLGGVVVIWILAGTHEVLYDPVVWAFFGLVGGLYLVGPNGAQAARPGTRSAVD